MKKIKFLITLVTLLCSAQAAPLESFSQQKFTTMVNGLWNTIKSSITTHHKWALPIFGLGITYLVYKKYAGKRPGTTPSRPSPSIPNYNVRNITVLSQKSDATCGYHSLKNGLAFYEYCGLNHRINSNNPNFINEDYFEERLKIGKFYIIKYRKMIALKTWLQQKLKDNIKADSNLKSKYITLFQNMGRGLAEAAIEHITAHKTNFKINRKIIETEIGARDKNLYDQLSANLINQTFEIKITESLLNELFNNKHQSSSEWLHGNEIEELLKLVTNISAIRDRFLIIDDIDQLTTLEGFSEIKKKWLEQENYCHIFIIGTMKESWFSNIWFNNNGHWFVMATQKINNEKQYFVADSLGIDRTNDAKVRKIIETLNQN